LGARLASFDTNNDGHISIGELGKWKTPRYVLCNIPSDINDTDTGVSPPSIECKSGAIMEDLVFKETQNNMMKKLLIGAIISVVILMVSIFGLSFATATLAKDVSTNNGALTSSKTGEKLSTIAQGGGGVNVPLTPRGEDIQSRRLNEESGGYSVFEGTVLQELVWEAHDQATTSNAAVRTNWTDSDGAEHSITIDTNSLTTTPVNGTGAIFTDISVTYTNLVPDQSITLQVKVVCSDSSDLTCDVFSTSHTLHTEGGESSPTTRRLRESFPRELFGATEGTIPGQSCGLADNDFNINGGGNKIMKAEALKVKNRDLISKILKEANPVSTGNARQFIQAFHKTSEAYASESSGYDLANNNCLHFAMAYLKALGKEMKPHLVWYMAKRLADTIPGLVDKLLMHPTVIDHGSKVTDGSSATDVLIQMSWILDTKDKEEKSLRNVHN